MSEDQGGKGKQYKLLVNKAEKDWPERFINGAQILTLAGSPSDCTNHWPAKFSVCQTD